MTMVFLFGKILSQESWIVKKNGYFCSRVSPARHAPSELPQGLTAARVLGCSGAMQ
jgi:hypothetical protein